MKLARQHRPEFALLSAVLAISVLGFWDLYLGPSAAPMMHHHLHLATSFLWLLLLLFQLSLIAKGDNRLHRRAGLAVIAVAPLVVATTAALSVYSAQKGVAAGRGDDLIIQNVGVTAALAILIWLAFQFRKRRAVHGALLTSTAILFGGIALFFALLSFVPMFEIEGPDTFYRFGLAAMTGLGICIAAGVVMFATAPKTRWPYLLAAGFLLLNSAIDQALVSMGWIVPLTQLVGGLSPVATFLFVFVGFALALAATLQVRPRRIATA